MSAKKIVARIIRRTNSPTKISVKRTAYDMGPPACSSAESAASRFLEERLHSRFHIVRRTPRSATHEPHVAAAFVEFGPQERIQGADCFDVAQHFDGMEGVIEGTEQDRGTPNLPKEMDRAAAVVVVGGIPESVERRGESVVERPHRPQRIDVG